MDKSEAMVDDLAEETKGGREMHEESKQKWVILVSVREDSAAE